MLQLRLKSKIGYIDNYIAKQWDKSEDVLTAAIFGMALYQPFECILRDILTQAIPLHGADPFPSDVCNDDIYFAGLWVNIRKMYEELGRHFPRKEGGMKEPDGILLSHKLSLIIEAKRENEKFSRPDQIPKYVEEIRKIPERQKLPIWVLAVGDGNQARQSLMFVDLPINCHLLYIDWSTIIGHLYSNIEDQPGHIERLFNDIIEYKEYRKVRVYTGFAWPDNLDKFTNNKQIEDDTHVKWFPLMNVEWPSLPPSILKVDMTKFGKWLVKDNTIIYPPPCEFSCQHNSWFQAASQPKGEVK